MKIRFYISCQYRLTLLDGFVSYDITHSHSFRLGYLYGDVRTYPSINCIVNKGYSYSRRTEDPGENFKN